MTLRSRLQRLARALPSLDPLADDPEHQLWRLFYEAALEVLTPFPEARKLVELRMGVQEPCIFRPDWRRTVRGKDLRFDSCMESLWAALRDFPEGRRALEDFIKQAEAELAVAVNEAGQRQPE